MRVSYSLLCFDNRRLQLVNTNAKVRTNMIADIGAATYTRVFLSAITELKCQMLQLKQDDRVPITVIS